MRAFPPAIFSSCPSRRSLPRAATDRRGSRSSRPVRRATFFEQRARRGDAMAHDAVDRQALRAGRVRFDWSKARIALLRRRWAEGLSANTIAKELGSGVSRCAVLGKVHRLKLKQPEFKRHQWR